MCEDVVPPGAEFGSESTAAECACMVDGTFATSENNVPASVDYFHS